MAKASDNVFPRFLISEGGSTATPAANRVTVYAKSDGLLYSKDDAGVEKLMSTGAVAGLLNKYDATVAPAVTDDSGDGYAVGSIWIDVTGDDAYICVDASVGAAVWNPFEAAGSGAFLGLPLDEPPASPHAKDDEFNGSSLDVKWTNPLSAAVPACTIAVADGLLKLSVNDVGYHMFGIRQAAPTGSFSVMAKISYGDSYIYDIRCGVLAYINGAKGHVCGPFPQEGSTGAIGVTTASNTNDWSTYDGSLSGGGGLPYFSWTRIRWDSATSTIYFDLSKNGIDWANWSSRGSMSQPDFIGVGIYGNGAMGDDTPWIYVDWFRVTEP